MSMLLTISQPAQTEFGGRTLHDFSSRVPLVKSRVSPHPRVDSPVSSLLVSTTPTDEKMTGHHRGLPPPSAMTLPDPTRQIPPPSLSQPLGAMPAPPGQWHGQEDSMRNWLAAKAEEDKRKQEEEKTRQETLKLEQRKIEQSMLRESLQGGVPPSMVPLMYAGIAGANLANVSVDLLQQYSAQLQAAQQQLQQPSPDARRDLRMATQGPAASAVAQPNSQQILASQPVEPTQGQAPLQTTFYAYQPTSARPAPTSAPRSATHTSLPRLTTNEIYVHSTPQQGSGSAHPLHQSQTLHQDQPTSSPNIYFHHWVPPNESSKGNAQPQTPASKGEPHSAHPGSHLSESDYKESPRKRKAQGGHERAPPPPPNTSPPFSTTSSTSSRRIGHVRTRSNASRPGSDGRPDSRRDTDPPTMTNNPSSQPEFGGGGGAVGGGDSVMEDAGPALSHRSRASSRPREEEPPSSRAGELQQEERAAERPRSR